MLPQLRWALAAVVVLGLGCLIGRLSAPQVDVSAVRAAVEKDLTAALAGDASGLTTDFQRQLRANLDNWNARIRAEARLENQRLVEEVAESLGTAQQQDRESILAFLNRTEQKRQAEYVSLRRSLETVALVADDKFQRTETELGALASYAQVQLLSDHSNQPFDQLNHSNNKTPQ